MSPLKRGVRISYSLKSVPVGIGSLPKIRGTKTAKRSHMCKSFPPLPLLLVASAWIWPISSLDGAEYHARGQHRSNLQISRDAEPGKIVVSWVGRGVLERASSVDGRYHPVHKSSGSTSPYV